MIFGGTPAQAKASLTDASPQASCPADGFLCLHADAGFLNFQLSVFFTVLLKAVALTT